MARSNRPNIILVMAGSPVVQADEFPQPIPVFVAGEEQIDGVDNAAEEYSQYREQNVVVTNDAALATVSRNGSLISVPCRESRNGAVLLCSVPVGPKRTHGTVYVSLDGGKT